MEDLLQDYFETIGTGEFQGKCPLSFWKQFESRFKMLADLAKKYLGVPASSAAVERMFSISGHVLSAKRANMSTRLFFKLEFF